MREEGTAEMERNTGRAGESYVAQALQTRGYEILERNFHCRFGEIDIIARNRQYLVFVEVKTRERGGLTSPFEAVTAAKRRRLLLTAETYLSDHALSLQPRFDVAAVYTEQGKIVGEDYLENAFTL